jgi:hypothetical protein
MASRLLHAIGNNRPMFRSIWHDSCSKYVQNNGYAENSDYAESNGYVERNEMLPRMCDYYSPFSGDDAKVG